VAEHGPSGFNSYVLPTEKPGRETLIVQNDPRPDFIALTHIDNVDPAGQGDWIHDPFAAVIDGGKLYGLGAADQKAGSAAMLTALASFRGREQELPKIMLAFSGDEENDMTGIKALVEHFKKIQAKDPSYAPSFILTTGSDGEIGFQCRGVAEMELTFLGKTGHAAMRTPGTTEPINALQRGIESIISVSERLKAEDPTTLGVTTYNLASAYGGLRVTDGDETTVASKGNRVPDYLKAKVEYRPNGGLVNGQKIDEPTIFELIKAEAEARELTVEGHEQIHDMPAWLGKRSEAAWVEEIVREVTGKAEIPVWNAAQHGFEEGAELFTAASRDKVKPVPAAIWGVGKSSTFHQANEHVDVDQIPVHHEVLVRAYSHPQFKKK